ncbi:hypothetical protein BDV93DRAFT_560283 [Ceratobasidium sp. AG-I]|nr:hypothetical protein BDV93DRAFT_560283 [Ceratobasidium sp. AG-I]
MIGAWRDEADEAVYFDATSDMLTALGALNAEGLEHWHQTFMAYQAHAIGQRSSLRHETAGPAVYEWQNIANVVEYAANIDTAMELVDEARLPDSWKGLPWPESMTQQEAETLYAYIRAGQLGQIPTQRIFQFKTLESRDTGPAYQQCLVPPGSIHYGPGARLFVRRLLLAGSDDPYARAEALDHLPPIPDIHSVPRIFKAEEYKLLRTRLDDHTAFPSILKWTQDFEKHGPVQVSRGHWHRCWQTSTCFPDNPPDEDDGMDALGRWILPKEYFEQMAGPKQSRLLSFRRFAEWLHSGIILHPLTRTLMGGPFGIKWPVLIIAHTQWTLTQLAEGYVPDWADTSPELLDEEIVIIEQEIQWIKNDLIRSTKTLSAYHTARDGLSDVNEQLPTEFTFAEFWKHVYDEPTSLHDSDPPIVKARREVELDAELSRPADQDVSARNISMASKGSSRSKRPTAQFKVGPVTRSRKVQQNVRFARTFNGIYLPVSKYHKQGRRKESELSTVGGRWTPERHSARGSATTAEDHRRASGSNPRHGGSSILDDTGTVASELQILEEEDIWGLPTIGVADADDSIEMVDEGSAGKDSAAGFEPYDTEEMRMFSSMFHGDASDKSASMVIRKGKGKSAYRN